MSRCSFNRMTHWILFLGIALSFSLVSVPTHAQDAGHWRTGQDLYEKICGHCHKPEVAVGPLLAGRELPVEYVKTIVRSGFNGMPAFPASFIDDESIALVAKYVATLPVPPAKP
jgi:mono/diheme cytochrome c family protein